MLARAVQVLLHSFTRAHVHAHNGMAVHVVHVSSVSDKDRQELQLFDSGVCVCVSMCVDECVSACVYVIR